MGRSFASEIWSVILCNASFRTACHARAVEITARDAVNLKDCVYVEDKAGHLRSDGYRFSLMRCVDRNYNMPYSAMHNLSLSVRGLGDYVNFIREMPRLTQLSVRGCGLSDADLSMLLMRVPNVTMLMMFGEKIGPLTIAELGSHTSVSTLSVQQPMFTEPVGVFALFHAVLYEMKLSRFGFVSDRHGSGEMKTASTMMLRAALDVALFSEEFSLESAFFCGRTYKAEHAKMPTHPVDWMLMRSAYDDSVVRYSEFKSNEVPSREASLRSLTLHDVEKSTSSRGLRAAARVARDATPVSLAKSISKAVSSPSPKATSCALPKDRNERRKLLLPADQACQACGVVWLAGSVTISQCETFRSQCKVHNRSCLSRQSVLGLL